MHFLVRLIKAGWRKIFRTKPSLLKPDTQSILEIEQAEKRLL